MNIVFTLVYWKKLLIADVMIDLINNLFWIVKYISNYLLLQKVLLNYNKYYIKYCNLGLQLLT